MKLHFVSILATVLVILVMNTDLSEGRHKSRSRKSRSRCPTAAPATASPITSAPATPSGAVAPAPTSSPAGTAVSSTVGTVNVPVFLNYIAAVYFAALNSGLSASASCNTICATQVNLCSGCIGAGIAPIPPVPADLFDPPVANLG